jgi:hypothetical protein
MPPRKTRPKAGSRHGEPKEKTFLDYLLEVLLEPCGSENPAIKDRQRLVNILALNSEYIRRSGADANYAARDKITLFIIALRDLNDGVTHPIFKAKKLSHGKRPNSFILRSRTTLAIALDYLIAADVPARVALKEISKTPGIKKLLSKRAAAEKSPLNWRTRLNEERFPTDLVREQWDQSRKVIAELTGSPSDKRKFFKAEAARLIAAAAEEIKEISV